MQFKLIDMYQVPSVCHSLCGGLQSFSGLALVEMSFWVGRQAGRQAGKHTDNYIQCDVHSLLTEVCARCDSRVGGEFALLGSKNGFTEVVTFKLGLEEGGKHAYSMNREAWRHDP